VFQKLLASTWTWDFERKSLGDQQQPDFGDNTFSVFSDSLNNAVCIFSWDSWHNSLVSVDNISFED
jgi:hypothetical protein